MPFYAAWWPLKGPVDIHVYILIYKYKYILVYMFIYTGIYLFLGRADQQKFCGTFLACGTVDRQDAIA